MRSLFSLFHQYVRANHCYAARAIRWALPRISSCYYFITISRCSHIIKLQFQTELNYAVTTVLSILLSIVRGRGIVLLQNVIQTDTVELSCGGFFCTLDQPCCPAVGLLVAWHSGRTSVFGRRTFPVLRSTCCGPVTTYVGKPSAIGQPTRPTQPFIPSESISE